MNKKNRNVKESKAAAAPVKTGRQIGKFFLHLFLLAFPLFLTELLCYFLMHPTELWALAFGGFWALLLAAVVLLLPRLPGRILYGLVFYATFIWSIMQAGYYQVFGKLMWISTLSYAGEAAGFVDDVLGSFPPLWWISLFGMILLGALILWRFPKSYSKWLTRLLYLLPAALAVIGLSTLPETVFLRDLEVWGTRSEYGQANSYRAMYNTMYDARNVYNICGIYQMTFRDIWKHEVYPLTPAYQLDQKEELSAIDAYFAQRGDADKNEMTGIFAGKNVIFVLMESMDDWLITEADTPTLYQMMDEGINFENFYTPGYGSARTLNSEFCFNTGIYLPTTGSYVFNYVTNTWDQSMAAQMTANGYTSEVFHYNDPDFYSRGVFEPAMGYNSYVCYADYTTDEKALYNDNLLFEIPEINDLFFREGPTFNTIITRSAHLGYTYNEVLSHYGLKIYPEYKGMYGSEEEDCARLKAKLVDDMFARLLQELESQGQLENTVIVGMTDHYTYGYKNTEELLALNGVDQELLLEKVPFFVWSDDCPDVDVKKTICTADALPTVLNLMGIDSPYHYLGQDAFDPDYVGYAIFPDGSWASEGIFCRIVDNQPVILQNLYNLPVEAEDYAAMAAIAQDFIGTSNLLLTSDYYKEVR